MFFLTSFLFFYFYIKFAYYNRNNEKKKGDTFMMPNQKKVNFSNVSRVVSYLAISVLSFFGVAAFLATPVF